VTAVKIDAMTAMGEFLKQAPKNEGTKGQLVGRGPSGGYKSVPPEAATPTLADAGISNCASDDSR
jgi:hypothetical protein